ncbi:MAG: NAD(P)H-dependent oxidoreductase subunit E, partial [Pseudonocardia sediminis]
MDLHLSEAAPSTAERDAIDAAFAAFAAPAPRRPGSNGSAPAADRPTRSVHAGHGARSRRHLLLPVLHAVSDAVGWISEGALNHIAVTLSVPPAEIYGVATFYAMFSVEPRAPRVVHVCDDVACGPYGGEEIIAELERELGPEAESPDLSGDGEAPSSCWVRSPCLGLCERAPAVMHQRAGEPDLSQAPARAEDVLAAARATGAQVADDADRVFADATVSAPQT